MFRSSVVKSLLLLGLCAISNVAEAASQPPMQEYNEPFVSQNFYTVVAKILTVRQTATSITVEASSASETSPTGIPTDSASYAATIGSAVDT